MKYIIATHGKMASGIKNTIEMLSGKKEDIYAIDAYVENQDFAKVFEELVSAWKEECIYVFTDIMSGSVNQEVFRFLDNDRIRLITGVNLPVIMEIVFRNKELDDEEINSILEEARQHLMYMNLIC